MQLKWNEIKQNIVSDRAFSQITFDDDYVIRDNKPDVGRIVCIKGTAVAEDQKLVNGSLWLTGKVLYEMLYLQEDGHKPVAISGTVPFQEKIMMDNVQEEHKPKVFSRVEEISAAIINSRKVSVRGLLDVEVILEEEKCCALACGVDDEMVEQKVEQEQLLCLESCYKDVLKVQKELQLPKSKPNIGEIIFYYLDIRNKELDYTNGSSSVMAEAHLCILYRSEEDQEEWYDTTFSVEGRLDCKDTEGQIYWAKIEEVSNQIEVEPDYDREMRQFTVDIVFDVDLKVWKECEILVLKDAYSKYKRIKLEHSLVQGAQLLVKNVAKIRLIEEKIIDSMKEKILQICGCKSSIHIDYSEVRNDKVHVEGVLQVCVLYITSNDEASVGHEVCQIPFVEDIEAEGIGDRVKYQLNTGVDQLQVNLLDNETFEVKATVSVGLLAMEENELYPISEIEELGGDNEECQNMPGIIGYIVQEDESLWDIAKRYCATVDEIREINGIENKEPQMGDKLLIVKNYKAFEA